MRAGTDLLGTLDCSDGELDLPPVDFRHLSLPGDQASNRRRREMAHVDGRADRALTGIEISPDRIEGSVFHDHDHHGVANTGGRIASLNRSARCSGWTRRLTEPLAPRGSICFKTRPV